MSILIIHNYTKYYFHHFFFFFQYNSHGLEWLCLNLSMTAKPTVKSLISLKQEQDRNMLMALPQAVNQGTALTSPQTGAKSHQGVHRRARGLHYLSWGTRLAQRSAFWDVLSPCGTPARGGTHDKLYGIWEGAMGQLTLNQRTVECHEMGFPVVVVRTNLMPMHYSFLSRPWINFLSKVFPTGSKQGWSAAQLLHFQREDEKIFQSSAIPSQNH